MQTKIQVFEYNGHNISFDFGDGNRMINATEMAKAFGKKPNHFLRSKQTQAFINVLSQVANLQLEKIIKVIHGGNQHGTWMHEKLALKFAAWLSPEFEVWVYDKIQELLHKGYTTILPESIPLKNITFIYFFKAVNLNRVKIGMSRNVHNRLGTMQSASPDQLELIKIIRTNDQYPDDMAVHALFPHLRVHGEWFELTEELQNFINELDSVPVREAAAHYEFHIAQLHKQLEEERQKVFQKNHLIQNLLRQLGQVQEEYQNLLKQLQEIKELQLPAFVPPPSLASDSSSSNPNSSTPNSNSPTADVLYLLKDENHHQVHTKDIVFIKPIKRGAICRTIDGESYYSELSMEDALKQLPASTFMQVHKNCVINLRHLTALNIKARKLILSHTKKISVSPEVIKRVVRRLQFLKKNDEK